MQEFLLVFSTLAIYVDYQGRKSREKEIMYPAPPVAIVHYDSHLLIYSETHVDVLDCSTGDWIQTLNLKRCRPLTSNGLLSACFATEQPYVVYLRNTNKGAWDRGVRRGSNAPALSLVVGLLIGFETSQHRL